MNEKIKTTIFVLLAIATTAIAVVTRPQSGSVDSLEDVGKKLFPEFTDPAQAKSLKVIRFDESLASLSEIEVREKDGIWTLPSHEGYPADAENRIRDATTPFIDLNSLAVVSDSDGDQALYGVLEPNVNTSAVGDQGVGTLVSVSGEGSKELVDLVIGKEVKGADGQRYVRRPGQSRVYIAAADPNNLPVKFDDWIEKDLLKLNAFDISQIVLKDYNFDVGTLMNTTFTQRSEITISDDNGTWKLDDLQEEQGGQLVVADLAENEQLNQDRLRELKEALDELEIVNVQRKPERLGADLRAEEGFDNDKTGIESLIERGFYPVEIGDRREVLSADGEVRVRTKEGVEYVLRFGSVAGVDTDEGALNRYLMVSTNINDAHFPPPELEVVPQSVDDLTPADADAAAETDQETSRVEPSGVDTLTQFVQSTDDGAAEAVDQVEAAQEAASDVDNTDAAAEQTADTESTGDQTTEAVDGAEDADLAADAAEDADTGDDAPGEADSAAEITAEESTAEESTAEESTAEESTAEDTAETEASEPPSAEELAEQLKSEQERITKENQRKIDERNDNLEKANEKVRELNYRFADWYYVISDEVYQKIHVSRSDVVEAKPSEADAGSSDATATPPSSTPFNGLNFPSQ